MIALRMASWPLLPATFWQGGQWASVYLATAIAVSSPGFSSTYTGDALPVVEAVDSSELTAIPIAGPFEFPWSIAPLPDGRFLVSERPGRLRLVSDGTIYEIVGVPEVLSTELAGLLDIAVDPHFLQNGFVYLSYVHGTPAASSVRVLSARLDQTTRMLQDQRVIFESIPPLEVAQQYGGRLAITSHGHLFLTLGDRWRADLVQALTGHTGTIVRLHTDGTVPGDNPFVFTPAVPPEIWSYGHRNSQGLALDPRTGALWSHEHGPMGGDELNLIAAGRNYGWPIISHGRDYSSGEVIGNGVTNNGMEQPFYHWTPAIAPSGLAVLSDEKETTFWIGGLTGQSLIRLDIPISQPPREQRFLAEAVGRVRDVRVGFDRQLYLITDSTEGWLYRLDVYGSQALKVPK